MAELGARSAAPIWAGNWRSGLEPLLAERDRWLLWLPVGMGAGAAIYLSLAAEPGPWTGPTAALGLALAAMGARRTLAVLAILFALAVAIGFASAQWRAATIGAPVLSEPIGPVAVEGRVAAVERRDTGMRIVIAEPVIAGLAAEATPARVRVTLNTRQPPEVGQRIALRAQLHPLPLPSYPGGHDFGRELWFRGIGGVGFALGGYRVTGGEAVAPSLDGLRRVISERIGAQLSQPAASVTTAIVTGERGPIPTGVEEAIRAAGLTHLLAISGLHIGLVAGCVYVAVRRLLALAEPLALGHPIKKWAAVAAVLAAGFYTALVDAPVSAQRAFAMTAIAMLAVLLDRTPLSMRLVAWAAAAILLVQPEAVASASFQMSFGAVIALIAFYEAQSPRWRQWRANAGWLGRIGLGIGTIAATSLVAGLATAPFGLYHFNQIVPYGLAANLLAVPLTTFWIMPWAMLACLLMPFGLEGLALAPVGWGIDLLIAISRWVAGWPGALMVVPEMSRAGFVAVVLGALWLCLWVGRWRWWGVAVIGLGLAFGWAGPQPSVLVNEAGALIGVRDADGRLLLSDLRHDRFAANAWRQMYGQTDKLKFTDGSDAGLRCDSHGCIYELGTQRIALVRSPDALGEDCGTADAVIFARNLPRWCRPALRLGRNEIAGTGGFALRLDGNEIRMETVAGARGRRPWTGGQ